MIDKHCDDHPLSISSWKTNKNEYLSVIPNNVAQGSIRLGVMEKMNDFPPTIKVWPKLCEREGERERAFKA